MENKKLIFFNQFHNGDIHASRQFVKDIISKIKPSETYYYHKNSSTVLKDIDLIHIKEEYPVYDLYIINDEEVVINTWFHTQYGHKYFQCTLEALYYNFSIIYKKLEIKLEPIEYYIPTIDYSKFNISNIDEFFLNRDYEKYIFFSNGGIESFQSTNESMDLVVDELSKNEKNLIILTEESPIIKDNIILSKDIIKSGGRDDLNENSYLSTKCDVIIGRESGPYFFTYVKENAKGEKPQKYIVSSHVKPFLFKHFGENKSLYVTTAFGGYMEQIKKIIDND